jgi:glycosyltransferase involved in cell wall biosynthesis
VTILTPHTSGVETAWNDGDLRIQSFRYAPESLESVGYSRSLSADEAVKWRTTLVSPLYLLGAMRCLKSVTGRLQPDLVHAHWAVPNGLVAAASRLPIPFGIGLHGSDVFLAEKGAVRPFMARALERSSFLTGCSPELVDRVCALGFDRKRSAVIPYGVDIDQFRPDPSRRYIWREKLEIPEDSTVVLSVGRMVTKKGFHILLPTLARLLANSPETHVVLGGQGDRLQEFKSLAAKISDRIHFPGVVLRDTLPDLYRAADLFVLPAVHDSKGNVDGLPNVILEAMASGLPVVASEISGIPLAVKHEREGYLVPEQQHSPLENALAKLLGDSDLRQQMGSAARRKAKTDLTWASVAQRYRDSYLAALSRSNELSLPN